MAELKLPHDHGCAAQETMAHMPQAEEFQMTAEIFKLLGDCSRIRIFWLLCHCEECVINISAMVQMSPPAVSHHLKLLRANGLITSRREGKEVYYKAVTMPLAQQLHNMIKQTVQITCPETCIQKEGGL